MFRPTRLTSLALLALASCGTSAPADGPALDATDSAPADAPLADAPAEPFAAPDRMLLRAQWRLAPGEERYQCFTTRWRRDGGIDVRRIVPNAGAAVHHIGVFTDPLRGEPAGTRQCEEMGTWGFVYGAGVGTGPLQFPDGTALHIDNGLPIILQLHLLNASSETVDTTTTVELQLAPAGATLQPVGSWVVGSTNITLPPGTRTDVNTTCTMHPAMEHVFATFPHMHSYGTALRVTAGTDMATTVVSIPRWDFGDQGTLPVTPEVRIPADMPIQTRCSYNNTSRQTVNFGLRTTDEMCAIVLYYWPATGRNGLQLCQE